MVFQLKSISDWAGQLDDPRTKLSDVGKVCDTNDPKFITTFSNINMSQCRDNCMVY